MRVGACPLLRVNLSSTRVALSTLSSPEYLSTQALNPWQTSSDWILTDVRGGAYILGAGGAPGTGLLQPRRLHTAGLGAGGPLDVGHCRRRALEYSGTQCTFATQSKLSSCLHVEITTQSKLSSAPQP